VPRTGAGRVRGGRGALHLPDEPAGRTLRRGGRGVLPVVGRGGVDHWADARRRRRCHARRGAVTTETIDLAGAGVVVTGGGKGIGAALAARFAAEGARVDRKSTRLNSSHVKN